MVKYIQTIQRQQTTNRLSVFNHFVRLALKGLTTWKTISMTRQKGLFLRNTYQKPFLMKSLVFLLGFTEQIKLASHCFMSNGIMLLHLTRALNNSFC